MPDKEADTTIAHQVELAIGRLNSLSILPCVAAQLFPRLLQGQFSPSTDIIESDPALTARILSLMGKHSVSKAGERFSLRQGLDRLPAGLVRDTLLSIGVIHLPQADSDNRKQLILHSLAVACCAKDIAEITLPQMDSQLAYCAGLLHDIGKFALEEAMPKSFVRIIEEAKSQNACSSDIEKKRLGIEHTLLGKHLAQKWCFPDAIALAIWLHHSDTVAIYQNMSEARLAAIVQLADSMARQSGIGQSFDYAQDRSGSFDSPAQIEPIANVLGIDLEQLKPIRQGLTEQVQQRAKILGLDMPNAMARYADAARAIAAQLARDNTKLCGENRQLQTISGHFDFITEFLLSINPAAGAIDIAENFATRWQKFYQTGMVCLYLAPAANSKTLDAVVVQELGQSKATILNVPEDSTSIPKIIANSFAILDAHDCLNWLFEQLDVDFDVSRTKLVPLLSNGRAIGAIAFELNWPVNMELFAEELRVTTSIAGAILDMAVAGTRQERFAERFAQLISKPEVSQPRVTKDYLFIALAEMAAGAAHELNNPLSVISGRAQLLAETETDKERKRIIDQIEKNAGQIAQIIEDLMSFAKPPKPKPARTALKQILNEAVQLASQKTRIENINTQIEVAEPGGDVLVDSGQIVSALANIIVNAVESYDDKPGPIKITATPADSDLIRLAISDLGCGMDTETLQKATQPFFSAKTAGRKRGMGLAYAARLIQLNGGSLDIASKPGGGTTVTILLPRA